MAALEKDYEEVGVDSVQGQGEEEGKEDQSYNVTMVLLLQGSLFGFKQLKSCGLIS